MYVTWNTTICTLAFKAIFTKDSENPKALTLILHEMQLLYLKGCSASEKNIYFFNLMLKQDFNTKVGGV